MTIVTAEDVAARALRLTQPAANGSGPVSEIADLDEQTLPNANGSSSPWPENDLFRRWSMPELLAEPIAFEWMVRGLLADPTYGQVAGEMKTLKSTVLDFVMVGLAAGVPIFGQFDPMHARPVLVYVGEGGRALWTRRIRRICSAVGVGPADLDLHPCFDLAPIGSLVFQESLRRDLEEVRPALVGVDPWYSFHGTTTKASDLHQEGAVCSTRCRRRAWT